MPPEIGQPPTARREIEPGAPHLLRLLEDAQRAAASEFASALQEPASSVGPRRLRLLQLIPSGGCSQGDLAGRALITKQATAAHVAALVADGLLERATGTDDARVRIVRRTRAGDAVSTEVDRAAATVEREWGRRLGADRVRLLRQALAEVSDQPVALAEGDAPATQASSERSG